MAKFWKVLSITDFIVFLKKKAFTALLDGTDKIREEIDKHNYASGIFVDFPKAFDIVNHHKIIIYYCKN